MPSVQVFLPDELFEQVKERRLPLSQLIQAAVEQELLRLDGAIETGAPAEVVLDDDPLVPPTVAPNPLADDLSLRERARARHLARNKRLATH